MRTSIVALALAAAAVSGCVPAAAGGETASAGASSADVHSAIMAAIADQRRPEADRARDANRKPMEALMFAGVKPGDVVAELAPGGGWYTRLLAGVVGPTGHVYALVSPAQAQRPGGLDAINALAAQYGNITVLPVDYTAITLPRPADLAWTTENWHDFHNGPTANPTGIARSVFAALKPGGVFFVEDHAAAAGAGATVTSTLHRIEPATVISEVTSAGFRLDAQGDYLRHPADDHTAAVRDSSVQGLTDKLALRFRKPG